jgi:EAL domain-containing protein (putative c-di-GMP-specific phosphodiesterase class I)/GGDEF domain-containing protein
MEDKALLLRYEGAFPPREWERIGGERIATGVWRFPFRGEKRLIQHLDALAAATDPQTQRDTLALTLDDASGVLSGIELLANTRTLDVLIIRKRYGWLLGDFEHRVRIHFQPILDLNAEGQIIAYEALCRLADPMGPLLAGGQAFALASAAGRAGDLDVASQNLALARKSAGIAKGVSLFLNVLPQNLLQAPWRQRIVERMDELDIDHKDVVIEVVESEQADPMELAAACDDLRRSGIRIALDDIGAGFNGLSTLAAVRADFIKIDRSLVHQAQRSRVRTVLMEALVSMAQRLGTRVVAEGLERPEDILFCREMAIGYAQGFYFARPSERPAAEVVPPPPRMARTASRPVVRVDLTQMMDSAPSLDVSESQEAARELFREQPFLPSVVLTDGGHPVGLLPRGTAMSPLRISLGKACKPIRHILPAEASPASLARRLFQARQSEDPWIVVSEQGKYLGNVAPAMLVGSLISNRGGGDEAHPLTQLPTGPGLRHVLENRLAGSRPCVLVYIDLDHFKAYNDRYGFVRGDAMIRLLSELLRHAFVDRPELYLGHIGGDDFVLIAEEEDAAMLATLGRVIALFRDLALHLYDENDIRRGYFETGDAQPHPIANVSVAVVDGSTGRPATAAAAAERAAAMKKVAKSRMGSVMVKEGMPPAIIPIADRTRGNTWGHNAISALERIGDRPRKADPHLLDADFANYPYFEVVFELDGQGVQRYPNWINPDMYGRIKAGGKGTDRAHQSYFRSVTGSRLPYISPIYLSSATEDFCLTVALPLRAVDDETSGVLVADINIASLAEWAIRQETVSE